MSSSSTKVGPEKSNFLYIPLLKEEDARYAANTGISSANFYRGDIKSAFSAIKERVKDVVRSNPWICGTVKPLSEAPKTKRQHILNNHEFKGNIGQTVLVFPEAISDETINNEIDSILRIEQNEDPQVKRSSTYKDLSAACQSSTRVVDNRSNLYKSGERVTRITLIPVSNDEFCVVFAMSHLIADGDT